MTTYNTYQEAKIAMPEACICYDTIGRAFFGMPTREGTTLSKHCEFAEAENYCMTVEQFLKDGHKFAIGDCVLDEFRYVIHLNCSVESWNRKDSIDSYRYVLRAKALEQTETTEEKEAFDVMAQDNEAEIKPSPKYNKDMYRKVLDEACEQFGCIPSYLNRNIANLLKQHKEYAQALSKSNSKLEQPKPKRTKEEYVMFHPTPGDSVYLAHENKHIRQSDVMYLFVGRSLDDNGIFQHKSSKNIFEESLSLVRRKQIIELTERELFIDAASSVITSFSGGDCFVNDKCLGALFDSGKFKLAEGK